MKKLLLLLLICPLFIACSDNDKEGGDGYLTSLENVKSGIVGVWKSTVGGVYYTSYNVDGTTCSGFETNGNWETCTTYEIFKSGSNYIIRFYVIGGSSEDYSDCKILVLNEDIFEVKELNGERYFKDTRVK